MTLQKYIAQFDKKEVFFLIELDSRTYMKDAMKPTESLGRSGDFSYGCLEGYKGDKILNKYLLL